MNYDALLAQGAMPPAPPPLPNAAPPEPPAALGGMLSPGVPGVGPAGIVPGGLPPGGPSPGGSAQDLHQTRTMHFVQEAIRDFHRGGITRAQLAEAIADEHAYDYGAWKKENVVHPSRAIAHNQAKEEPLPHVPER